MDGELYRYTKKRPKILGLFYEEAARMKFGSVCYRDTRSRHNSRKDANGVGSLVPWGADWFGKRVSLF